MAHNFITIFKTKCQSRPRGTNRANLFSERTYWQLVLLTKMLEAT